ncbi:hypothetical protein NCC49_002971 [Naganishia albida]|nr:hypothetical protein NCC49_002971 [Naganishia albida]
MSITTPQNETVVDLHRSECARNMTVPVLMKDGTVLCLPPSSSLGSGAQAQLYLCLALSLITATLLFPLGLFLWRRVKQRRLRRKIEKEFEDDIALEHMPVLLEYPAKAHFEKSA